MSVVSVAEIQEGRGGSLRADVYTMTRVFRVTTDNKANGVVTVAGGVYTSYGVRAGSSHPEDSTAKCYQVDPIDDGTSGLIWLVTCSYSNASEHRDKLENPLSDAAIIGPWDSDSYQEVAEVDNDDKVIANSAGDPYDPPLMKDFSRRNVTVRKNVASVPEWFLDYEDAVNSDAFTVGGLSVPVGKAKCKKTQVSEQKFRNGIGYYEVTTVLQFSKKGWTRKVADVGFNELTEDGLGRKKIVIGEPGAEEYPSAPVPLDGSGARLENPTLANRVYNAHDIEDRLPFSVLPLS